MRDPGVCEIKAAGPYKFTGFGTIDVTKPCDIDGPKPYEFTGSGSSAEKLSKFAVQTASSTRQAHQERRGKASPPPPHLSLILTVLKAKVKITN